MMVWGGKALGKGGMAAAVVLLLASFASTLQSVEAQPPSPPNRVFGSVTLDGAPAAGGTVGSATIGGVEGGWAAAAWGGRAGGWAPGGGGARGGAERQGRWGAPETEGGAPTPPRWL